ncbi:MAG: GEVED domain-containing protein, partial [Ferruginibacter sp.]
MQTKFTQTSTGYYRKFFCIAIFFALLSSLSFAQNVPLKKQALLDRQMQLKMQQLSGVVGSVSSDNDAGRPNRVSPSPNGTQAICQTFTGSLLAGDLTMPQRLNRPGSTVGNCTTAFPFPGTFGTGPYFYDVIPYTNASGLTQCATITLTSTDVTNANIQFGLWSGAFNPTALATNYLADPGVSTGTPAAALPITVTLSAGQTVNIVVWSANVNTAPSGTASNYTVTIDLPLCSSAPCSGTPAPGNTIASAAAVCASTAVNLSLQNATAGAGVTYQWQSATALAGPYTNITGATGSTYSTLITACTYFRANVTCSGNTGTSTPVQVCLNPPSACYCIPTYVNGCGLGDAITRVTLLTLNNTSVCAAGPAYYTYYNAVAAPSLFTSSTYPLSVTFSTDPNQYFAAWADFNQDGDFADAGEFLGATTVTAGANGTSTINISIPAGASLGTTRLRIRGGDDSAPSAGQSCGASNSSFGETEDYNINISLLPPCTGTPAPGNTLSTFAPVCSGANFTLSLQNATFGSGVTYQWQSSATGAAGTYANITGATASTYTTSQTAATFYQAVVTCGAVSTASNPLQVTINAFYNCYCASVAGNTADEDIFNVNIGTLNNTSTCTSLAPGPGSVLNRYSNYRSGTGAPAPGTLFQGTTMPISITIGTCGGNFGNYTAVWIDFDHNGLFDATERVYGSAASTTGPHIETGNAIIPATALLGLTAMRVINREGGTAITTQPCAIYTWGETEDYLVNIVPCVQGVINTQPVNSTIGCGGNSTFSVAATGSLLVYSWEQRISATAPWTVVNNGGVFSGATTNTLTLTNAPVSMNGYQYRAVIQGGCTAVDYSNTA